MISKRPLAAGLPSSSESAIASRSPSSSKSTIAARLPPALRAALLCATLLCIVSCLTPSKVKDPVVLSADFKGYTTWTKVNLVPLSGDPFGILGEARASVAGIREIYVNDTGKPVSRSGSGFPYPVGTILVRESYEKASTDGKGAITEILAMVKRAPGYNPSLGDWEFLQMKPDLSIAARGRLTACMACHAPVQDRDFIFNNARTTVK